MLTLMEARKGGRGRRADVLREDEPSASCSGTASAARAPRSPPPRTARPPAPPPPATFFSLFCCSSSTPISVGLSRAAASGG